jgi:hypothetical protein
MFKTIISYTYLPRALVLWKTQTCFLAIEDSLSTVLLCQFGVLWCYTCVLYLHSPVVWTIGSVFLYTLYSDETFILISNLSILSVPYEDYSRKASCALSLISTFVLLSLCRYLFRWTISLRGYHHRQGLLDMFITEIYSS